MIQFHETSFRVRYSETDGQGVVHHANFFNYFEAGRIELLREQGMSYKELEAKGYFLVVADIRCKYRAPARFDDVLTLRTECTLDSPVKIEHRYVLRRDETLIATAQSLIVCVDAAGKIRRLPSLPGTTPRV